VIDVTEDEAFWGSVNQGEGSIVFEDLRLDLRRLLFGAIPLAKRVSLRLCHAVHVAGVVFVF
jgi:hypothetical protein